MQETDAESEPDWNLVEETVLQSCPSRPEDVPTICQFAQKYGGGKNGKYVSMLLHFIACCVPDDRQLSTTFLAAFNDHKLESHEYSQDFVIAAVMCQANCPDSEIKNGIGTFIKDSNTIFSRHIKDEASCSRVKSPPAAT